MHEIFRKIIEEKRKESTLENVSVYVCSFCLKGIIKEEDKVRIINFVPLYVEGSNNLGVCGNCSTYFRQETMFYPDMVNMKIRLENLDTSLNAHSTGVQNVYEEVKKVKRLYTFLKNKPSLELSNKIEEAKHVLLELEDRLKELDKKEEKLTDLLRKLSQHL